MKNFTKGLLANVGLAIVLALSIGSFLPKANAALGFSEAEDMFALQKSDRLTLNSPLGFWELPDEFQNGFQFSLRFKLNTSEVTVANRCIYNGQVAYVSTTAPAILTNQTLQITGSARNTVNIGGMNCNVSITAGPPQQYSVVNGIMSLEGSPATALKLQDL